MKLSEAIRLGSMMSDQIFGKMLTDDRTGACALGAAALACGIKYRADVKDVTPPLMTRLVKRFPILSRVVTGPYGTTHVLETMIADLNDEAKWTREQIADFVETIEATFATAGVMTEMTPSLTAVGATGLTVSSPKK